MTSEPVEPILRGLDIDPVLGDAGIAGVAGAIPGVAGVAGTAGTAGATVPKISMSMALVIGPTAPTVGNLYLAWKAFTALSVTGPKYPVTDFSG